jgi:3-demethoxyubiquinol 3-hydroxylase
MVSKDRLAAMLRVNQAGEYGAQRIYQGQLAILKNTPIAHTLQHMADQEEYHLQTFNQIIVERNVRPTFLQPLWHIGGFALGALTALMGEKAAHACTIAVEEVIAEHYQGQLDELAGTHPDIEQTIQQFQAEEIEHKNLAEQEGGREAIAFPALSLAIKTITRTAIWLSTRV